MYRKDVIQKLSAYLKAEGINQKQLSDRLAWPPADVNNLLKGKSPIGIKRLLHITEKLGIEFEIGTTATKISDTPPQYFTKEDAEIIAMMKPLSKKDKQDLKEYIAFLKTREIKAG